MSKSETKLLADQAISSNDRDCRNATNTFGDHAYGLPKTPQLASIFQTVAAALSSGSTFVTLPQ